MARKSRRLNRGKTIYNRALKSWGYYIYDGAKVLGFIKQGRR